MSDSTLFPRRCDDCVEVMDLTTEDRARAYVALVCLESGAHPLHLTELECAALEKAGFIDGEEPFSMDFLQDCPNVPEVVRLASDLLPPHLDAPEKCWACEGSGMDARWERNPCIHCDGDGYIL